MSATNEAPEEIESPGYGFGPNELPFNASWGSNLLESVVAAIWSSLDRPMAHYTETAAGEFISLLTQAHQRLRRVLTEGGPDVEEDALRAALPKLKKAAQLRGSPDGVDQFAKELAGSVRAPVGTHLHAASEILDWCIAGCRARLAEMEEAGNGDGSGDVSVARLFDVLNVARGCLELAADAELENSYDVSPRTVFGAVCDYLRPAYDDTLEALDRDPDEMLGIANNTLEALAGAVERDGSEEGE